MAWIGREALHRVLQSLIAAELSGARKKRSPASTSNASDALWPESLGLGEDGSPALGCDSIELLWLAAAVNEMFSLYEARVEDGLLSAKTFGEWLDIVERGWNETGHRITFSTSGSTGVPKRCTHELAHLQREVDFLAGHFNETRRVVAMAPPHHIYGFLFTAMLPKALGVPVLPGDTLAPGALAGELRSGDLLISVPTRWEYLARSLPRWPEGVRGITSTAPCPEPLKATLVENGLSSLTEIYGSSETAGIGVRTYPAVRYSLMPFWSWADRTEAAPKLQDPSGRVIPVQDALEIASDATFTVRNRLDGAVQVGGANVFPGRLETLLRGLPGVGEASVRLSTEPGRERLKAFIVPDHTIDERDLASELERWASTFAAPERILSFTFGTALPRSATGKLADWTASGSISPGE